MTYDLGDPQLFLRSDVLADPHPLYDLLRRDAPVWQLPGQNVFLVSDPALIRRIVVQPSVYSSNLVQLLHDEGAGRPMAFPLAPFGDSIHVLSTADPPIHTRHRKLLQQHLTPAAVSALEPALRLIIESHLDAFVEAGGGDFVAHVSDPVPAAVICSVLGLPPADVPHIVTLVSETGALLDGITHRPGIDAALGRAFELTIYVHEQLQSALSRPANERSGLLAVFADAIEHGIITTNEVTNILVVLVSAGSETTSSLLATMVETLARDSALQQRLRSSPELIPAAIEEGLRDDGPFQFHYRWTVADTSLDGTDIPAGSIVMLMWAAANRPGRRDGDVPSDADLPAQHFAFGKGMHFCIGAPLARLEARLAIEVLLDRTSSITLDRHRPPTRRPSIFIRRHASLAVDIA